MGGGSTGAGVGGAGSLPSGGLAWPGGMSKGSCGSLVVSSLWADGKGCVVWLVGWLMPGLGASQAKHQPSLGPWLNAPLYVSPSHGDLQPPLLLQERLQDQQVGPAQASIKSLLLRLNPVHAGFSMPFLREDSISPRSVGLVFLAQAPPPLCPWRGSLSWGSEPSSLRENLCGTILLFVGLPTREDGI